MTSSKDTIQETTSPEEKQAQEITLLEQQEVSEKQQALLNFQEKELEIDREKKASEESNQAQYDADLTRIEKAFENTPQASWSQYQAADAAKKHDEKKALLRHSNKDIEINAEHEQQTEKNTTRYNDQILEIERRFQENRLAVVQKYQGMHERCVKKDAKAVYELATELAWKTCDESIRQAKADLKAQSKATHLAAVKETNVEAEKFHQARLEVREESYLMLAEAMGLDGIADDIWGYVSKNYKYADAQPLLGYTDLRLALAEAAKSGKNSDLIDGFYSVTTEGGNVDVSELEAQIQSLDLAATSQLFKHECVFMEAPSVPEKNKLYIDLRRNSFRCTLLSPYGDVISKSYTEDSMLAGNPLKTPLKNGSIRNYIQKRSAYFVMDLNYGTRASTFDAFRSLIDAQKGFKAHVMDTIVSYNRELARVHGFDGFKLCNKHLACSSDQGSPILEETPFYQLSDSHNKITSEISKWYYAECEVLKKACEQAILAAETLRDDICREAALVYHTACGKKTAATNKQQKPSMVSAFQTQEVAINRSDAASTKIQPKQSVVTDESLVSPTDVATPLISPLTPQVQAKADAKIKRRADGIGFFEKGKHKKKPLEVGLSKIEEDETVSVPERVEEKAEVGKISGSYDRAEFDEEDVEICSLLAFAGLN